MYDKIPFKKLSAVLGITSISKLMKFKRQRLHFVTQYRCKMEVDISGKDGKMKLKNMAGPLWRRLAMDRGAWQIIGVAFAEGKTDKKEKRKKTSRKSGTQVVLSQIKSEVYSVSLRKQCKNADEAFLEKHLVTKEPFGQFRAWYDEVCAAKVLFPGAMCLATVSKDGFPSARYVICTSFSKDGFKFFTDYGSRKSTEIDNNPNVAATFYWAVCDRSVRIEGEAEKLPEEESAEAFKSRPVDAQVAIWASSQSIPIGSKEVLAERLNEFKSKFLKEEVPKPSHWGGYIIRPSAVEFWQAQSNRLSDRIRFRRPADGELTDGKLLHEGEDGWVYERLSP